MKLYSDIGKVAKSKSPILLGSENTLNVFTNVVSLSASLVCFIVTSRNPELLNDDYIYAKKLKITSKSDDGVSYTATGVQCSKDDDIDAELSAKYKVHGATLTGKAFTGGKLPTLEVKYETSDSKGRKVALTGLGGRDQCNGNAEIQAGLLGAKIGADVVSSDLQGSLAVAITSEKYSGFMVVGGDGQYSISGSELTKGNAAVSFFDGKESEITVHLLDKMKTGMVSYSHHVRPGYSVAAQMTCEMDTKETAFIFGGAYRLGGGTTVKAKADSGGSMALSYIQDVRADTKLIMSSMFNVKKLDSAKVGISLAIE